MIFLCISIAVISLAVLGLIAYLWRRVLELGREKNKYEMEVNRLEKKVMKLLNRKKK